MTTPYSPLITLACPYTHAQPPPTFSRNQTPHSHTPQKNSFAALSARLPQIQWRILQIPPRDGHSPPFEAILVLPPPPPSAEREGGEKDEGRPPLGGALAPADCRAAWRAPQLHHHRVRLVFF